MDRNAELTQVFEAAVRYAIDAMGVQAFEKTSFFKAGREAKEETVVFRRAA